jgi:hypothetical protein
VAIFVKSRGGDLLMPGTVDYVENYAPLGNINRRVLEEVVKENLDNMIILDPRDREMTYVVKF